MPRTFAEALRCNGLDNVAPNEWTIESIERANRLAGKHFFERGWLAGWTMGAGMCASLSRHVWDNARDAAYEAHRMAEYDAERGREYQEAERERMEADERAEELAELGEVGA